MNETMTTYGAPPVRASDAEREQAAEIVRAGCAEGRLSSAELDARLTAALPFADPESGTGMRLNVCLLLCLLCVCPPAGIAYWILAVHRQPQLTVPERSSLLGAEAGQ